MTGQFTQADPVRCRHYARFMSRLSLAQANAVFWLLFIAVLFLLYISSRQHHKSVSLSDLESMQNVPRHTISRRKEFIRHLRRRYLGVVAVCLIIATALVILEVFAAFNIQYCDGEDLMMLYWGFWSVLQVGSIIAIFGVMLQLWIVLADVDMPSWAVALGTPVLVLAALVYFWDHTIRKLWKKTMRGDDEWREEEEELEIVKTGSSSRKSSRTRDFDHKPSFITRSQSEPRRHSSAMTMVNTTESNMAVRGKEVS